MVYLKKKYDSVVLGAGFGILAPVIPFAVYYWINYSFMSFRGFMRLLELAETFVALMSLCVVTNLLLFFIFIWTHRYYSARGVLLTTFIYAGAVFFLKLM